MTSSFHQRSVHEGNRLEYLVGNGVVRRAIPELVVRSRPVKGEERES